ncbi:MAG TPA: type II secretion system inner membrane protein GspF [Geopsychrobacteraceae bacterium]|nr:type II secretion system inner membrane protein GspF [Geopsychrobacteraceae bacterium]
MALYEYSALDNRGKRRKGTVEASGRQTATRQLRDRGLFPEQLQEVRSSKLEGRQFVRRVQVLQLAVATRQLATMLAAGMTIDESLATVADQQEPPVLGKALARVREDVLQGVSLSQALRGDAKIFPDIYVNMVQVGEASGTLDKVLQQLAEFLEDQARLSARLKAALSYPLLMLLVGGGVLAFLMAFVVPKVTRMLEDLDQALPLPTLWLMGVSSFMADFWWLLVIIALIGFWIARQQLKTERGRLWFDRKKFRLPLFGPLLLQGATARFARTMGTLLRSGVPLLTALEIVTGLLNNQQLKKLLTDVNSAVREGSGLAGPLRKANVFPAMLPQMIAVGEKSGDLEAMLIKVAENYEYQVETRLNGLMSLLEPLMILVMGVAVGFIVLAILLPIFQASQGMG